MKKKSILKKPSQILPAVEEVTDGNITTTEKKGYLSPLKKDSEETAGMSQEKVKFPEQNLNVELKQQQPISHSESPLKTRN